MKKLLSILFAIVAAFTLTFGLAACGEDEDDDDPTVQTPKDDDGDTEEATFWGTYYFYSMTEMGETIKRGDTVDDVDMAFTKNFMVFIINEDGTFTCTISMDDGKTVYEELLGTWTGSGTSYVFTATEEYSTETYTLIWDGNKTVTFTSSDMDYDEEGNPLMYHTLMKD